MMKSILFLTDLTNGETEDLITANHLNKEFNVRISYLENIESIENNFDLIIIRNTWPSDKQKFFAYIKLKQDFLNRVKKKKLKVYNDLNASADRLGKNYLIELYKKKYPVIPSVDNINDLNKLPKSREYLLKPKNGFSSIGIKSTTFAKLSKSKISGQIVQPKLSFEYEISFYFVDDIFLYCLIFEPSKVPVWQKPKLFESSKEDLIFARKFVSWNKMKSGIQRIDAVRLLNGDLLLLEIEDDSPYFSLTEINEELKNSFLERFTKSVKNYMK